MTNTLPNRIRECRQRTKLSMNALAKQVGTSKSQIDKLERGERRLTLEWMLRIAEVLNCHPAEFLPSTLGQRSQTDRWLAEYRIEVHKVGHTLNIGTSQGVLIQLSCPQTEGEQA